MRLRTVDVSRNKLKHLPTLENAHHLEMLSVLLVSNVRRVSGCGDPAAANASICNYSGFEGLACISSLHLARSPCLSTPFLTSCFRRKRKAKLTTSTSGVVGKCCKSSSEACHLSNEPRYTITSPLWVDLIKSRLEHAFLWQTSVSCTTGRISGIPTSWRRCLGSALPPASHEARCRRCAACILASGCHVSNLHT